MELKTNDKRSIDLTSDKLVQFNLARIKVNDEKYLAAKQARSKKKTI